MSKNNCLLLIFPKRDAFIFIFTIIVVYFLTTVSRNAFAQAPFPLKTFKTVADNASALIYNFEDGNLWDWKQTTDWEVSSAEPISGTYSLKHLSKNIAGNSSVFHRTNINFNQNDIEWSFKIKNGKWDPSADNRFWFYLCADTILPELINGWALGVNIKGNADLLELWRIQNGKPDSLIIQSDLDWNASTLATIDIQRNTKGNWSLTYTKPGEATSQRFSGTDLTVAEFKNIGLYFNYTITRAGQLWMDDISVIPTPASIFIQKLTVINSHTISLKCSSSYQAASLQINNFQLRDENNLAIPIVSVAPSQASNQEIEIQLGKVTGVQMSLSVSGITDLSGKAMEPQTLSFPFSFLPEVGSVLINEVLFNPLTGGVDFVELVNVSGIPVSVHHLKLATRNDTLALKQVYALSSTPRYLNPAHYLSCTKDPQAVIPFYISNDPETFCPMSSFPTYPDAAGTVVLLNDSLEVIDEFSYVEKMHSPFLASKNGVSLERISLDKPATDQSNWTSATSTAGFATPGLPNSQSGINSVPQDQILPEPVVFSPNGDGFNDLLTIHFNLVKPGYIANVRIFDVVGRQVKFLVKNQSLAQQGSWTWNGDSDTNQRLKLGVYIILVELFDPEGHTKTFKKTCTLSDRLR
ncbi:MAG TPA: gliding motility-associated C-terminal domain-containing protein [Prolixibacteraceae bacterium]